MTAWSITSGVAGAYGKCWAQKWQVRTYFCLERAGNRGEKVKKMPHPRGEPEERKRRRTWDYEGG